MVLKKSFHSKLYTIKPFLCARKIYVNSLKMDLLINFISSSRIVTHMYMYTYYMYGAIKIHAVQINSCDQHLTCLIHINK